MRINSGHKKGTIQTRYTVRRGELVGNSREKHPRINFDPCCLKLQLIGTRGAGSQSFYKIKSFYMKTKIEPMKKYTI